MLPYNTYIGDDGYWYVDMDDGTTLGAFEDQELAEAAALHYLQHV